MLLAMVAAVAAMLHELALLRPVLLAPGRYSPLWAIPALPMFFFFSGVCAGLAVIIFSARYARVAAVLSGAQLGNLGRWLATVLFLYLLLRFQDFLQRGIIDQLAPMGSAKYLLGLELALLLLPILLLAGGGAENSTRLMLAAEMAMAGVMTNRLNTLITAVEARNGFPYFPTWTEMVIALSIAAAAVAAFTIAARRWGVFGTVGNDFSEIGVPQGVAALLPPRSAHEA